MFTSKREQEYNILDVLEPPKFELTSDEIQQTQQGDNAVLLGATLRTNTGVGRTATVKAGEDIRPALESLKSAGGGTLILLEGIHKPTYDIVGDNKINITGVGADQTIIDFNSGDFYLTFQSKSDFSISNLTVKNSSSATANLYIRDCIEFNVSFVNSESAVNADGFYISACGHYSISNCNAKSNFANGFAFWTENFGESDNYNYVVTNCTAESNTDNGFQISTSSSFVHFQFAFIGCSALNNTNDGISFEDSVNIVGGSVVSFQGNNNNWTMDVQASRLAIVGCGDSNGTQFLRTASDCQSVTVIGCAPTGDFNIQGDVSVSGSNIGKSTTVVPSTSFNDIVDTKVKISGTYGGNGTTERDTEQVLNTKGSSLAVGDVVIIKNAADGDEITTTTTQGDNKVYGMALEAITNNQYGFILKSGYTKILKVNGTDDIAIGDYLSTYTTAGIAAKARAGDQVFAIALEAYTTNDSSGVIDAYILPWRFPLVTYSDVREIARTSLNFNTQETLVVDTTEVGNVGTGQDDLISYTMPANTMTAVGDTLKIRAWGEVAATANNKDLFFKMGTTTLMDYSSSFTTSAYAVWVIEVTIVRTAVDTFTFYSTLNETNGKSLDTSAGISEDDGSTIILKCQGTATANDDIVQKGLIVELIKA